MTTLSVVLPDILAKTSQEVARKFGLSRTQLIRQALTHELENLQLKLERESIVRSIAAMKNDKDYLSETEEIMEKLNAELPEDEEEWWNRNKS